MHLRRGLPEHSRLQGAKGGCCLTELRRGPEPKKGRGGEGGSRGRGGERLSRTSIWGDINGEGEEGGIAKVNILSQTGCMEMDSTA